MADNVTADPGAAGAVFATDDIGGVHYPIGKLTFGALNSQTIASSGAGNIDAGTQRVVIATDQAVVSTHDANFISTDNSTATPINADLVYTGTGEDISQYAVVTIQIDSSHNSATDGMTFQFSTDDVNWDEIHAFTYTAADGARHFQFPAHAQYFRVVYTNGGTNQTTFRVQTILHSNATLTTIHRLADDVDPDRSAQIMKTALFAQAAGSGDFTAVDATAGGNLKVSVQEVSDGLDIGAGDAGAETQRVSISTDDVNLAAINAGQLGDGHNVTVDNGAAGAAVNIQDGGNTITVQEGAAMDVSAATVTVNGTVTANPASGTIDTVTNLAQQAGTAISIGTGARDAGTQRVTIATNDVVPSSQSGTWNVTNVSGTVSLPTGAATSAKQLADGHNVTVDNANLEVVGDVAHAAAAAGNPVLIAARATASVEGITESSEADSTYVNADLSGTIITRKACAPAELVSFYIANTDGAEDAVTSLDDGGAAIYNFITSVTIHNAHATTNGFVTLLDGSGGSIFWAFPAPALGGTTHNFDPPLRQPTISTALYVDVSAAITTMHISINGFQGQG